MYTRLGELTAKGRRALVRVKTCLLAVGLLTAGFFLTGCSSFLDPSGGSRFFQVISDILKLLPESIPTTPLEVFEKVFGEEFAETFEQWIAFVVQKPDIKDNIFGVILYWFTGLVLFMTAAYVARYIINVFKIAGKEGADNVFDGNTEIIPPHTYLVNRVLPVLLLVGSGPALVQFLLDFTWKIVTDFADALYTDVGQSIGSVMFELVVGMLEGANGWLFLVMLVVVLGVGFVVMVVYAWRYLSVFVYTIRMMLRFPKYLEGAAISHSVIEPIGSISHSIAVLGITWFVILVGPVIMTAMNSRNIPIVISLLVVESLIITGPSMIMGISGFAASKLYPKMYAFATKVDTDVRLPPPERKPSMGDRAWVGTKRVGGIAKEVGKLHPQVGPGIIAADQVAEAVRRRDNSEMAKVITKAPIIRGQFQENPILSRLINLAKSSMFKDQQHLDSAVFALCVEIAAGPTNLTKQQIVDEANAQLSSMSAKNRSHWRNLGDQVKRVT